MKSLKKWIILFLILIFPYIVVQIIEKSTHNILTLGYVENRTLELDTLGNIIEITNGLKFQILIYTIKMANFKSDLLVAIHC